MVRFDGEEFGYDAILESMLDSVPLDIDKREGGVIYNALAPAAAQLAQQYIWMDQILTLTFADTSVGEFLDLRAREVGIERFPATRAMYKANFELGENSDGIPLGSRFMIDESYFELIENDILQIETTGEPGNNIVEGTELLPLDNFIGLEKVTIDRLLERGSDAEDDESLRSRYFVRVRREANSGNKAHYKAWAEEVEGVGIAKVFPLSSGPGTVKIVITNDNYQPPIQSIVTNVQNHIAPIGEHGEGQAPIGATVTVAGATIEDVEISAKVDLQINRSIPDAVSEFNQMMNKYLNDNSFRIEFLNISAVSELLLQCDSVRDYSDVMINGSSGNFRINPEKIAALSSVELELM